MLCKGKYWSSDAQMPPPAVHNERQRHSNVLTEERGRLTASCMLLYDIYEEIAC